MAPIFLLFEYEALDHVTNAFHGVEKTTMIRSQRDPHRIILILHDVYVLLLKQLLFIVEDCRIEDFVTETFYL